MLEGFSTLWVAALLAPLVRAPQTQDEPAARPVVPELVRLKDVDLTPRSRWPDLAHAMDWIPWAGGVALLQSQRLDAQPGSRLIVLDASGEVRLALPVPARAGEPIAGAEQHAGPAAWITPLGQNELGLLPWTTGKGELAGVRVDLETATAKAWPMPAAWNSSGNVLRAPNSDLVLFLQHRGDSETTSLRRIAPDGTVHWIRDESERLCRGRAIRFASDGRILVLNPEAPVGVQIVGADGSIGRFVELGKLWGGRVELHDLAPGARGELYLDVSGSKGRGLVRTDAEFRVQEQIAPRFPDRAAEYQSMRTDEHGDAWIYDGCCFAHLDAHGVADRILGPPPGSTALVRVFEVVLTNDERIFALSAREGDLYELDGAGGIVRIIPRGTGPFPDDFRDRIRAAASAQADVLHCSALSFDAGQRRWQIEGDIARVLGDDDQELARVRIAPKESQFELRCARVSRKGVLAVAARTRAGHELTLLDPSGLVLAHVALDEEGDGHPEVAIDDERVAVTTLGAVEVLDLRGNLLARADIPGSRGRMCGLEPDRNWRVDLRPSTKELCLREGPSTLLVRRYELP